MCHNKFRTWLEIPPNGTLDIMLLGKSKFGFNIIDVSTKFTECQVVLRNRPKNSSCQDTKNLFYATSSNCNVQYDGFSTAKQVAKDIRKEKIFNIENKLSSQSLIITSIDLERCSICMTILQVLQSCKNITKVGVLEKW